MKKLFVIACLTLSALFFQAESQGAIIQYGILGKISKTSNAGTHSMKVGDSVYLYFKLDTNAEFVPIFFEPQFLSVYSDPLVQAELYLYRNNKAYYHASLDEDGSMIVQELSEPLQLRHQVLQSLTSPLPVPESAWNVESVSIHLKSLIDELFYSPLPIAFRLADAVFDRFKVSFKGQGSLKFNFDVTPTGIVFDNPNSL